MKVLLDATRCCGYGACAEKCPSVFAIDEFGFAALVGDGIVAAADEHDARAAIAECPEHAITVLS